LAAFDTYERLKEPIDSAEVLSRQSEIKYGTIRGGTTESFFKVN
jgi:ionotropic glutamate receptor